MPSYAPLLPTKNPPRPEDDEFLLHDTWTYCNLACIRAEFWCYFKPIAPILLAIGLIVAGLVIFLK